MKLHRIALNSGTTRRQEALKRLWDHSSTLPRMAFKAGTKTDAKFLCYVDRSISDQATEVYKLGECRLFVVVCVLTLADSIFMTENETKFELMFS